MTVIRKNDQMVFMTEKKGNKDLIAAVEFDLQYIDRTLKETVYIIFLSLNHEMISKDQNFLNSITGLKYNLDQNHFRGFNQSSNISITSIAISKFRNREDVGQTGSGDRSDNQIVRLLVCQSFICAPKKQY